MYIRLPAERNFALTAALRSVAYLSKFNDIKKYVGINYKRMQRLLPIRKPPYEEIIEYLWKRTVGSAVVLKGHYHEIMILPYQIKQIAGIQNPIEDAHETVMHCSIKIIIIFGSGEGEGFLPLPQDSVSLLWFIMHTKT